MSGTTLLSVREAAARLRKSERYVVDRLRDKSLRGSKFGGEWHIRPEDVDAFVEAHANVSRVRGRS